MLRRHMIRDESGLFSEEKFVMLRSKKSADGSTRYELTPISQWYKFDLKIQRSQSEMSMEQIDAIMKGKMQAREIRARVKPDDDEDQNSKLNGPRFESYRSAFKDPASKSSSSKKYDLRDMVKSIKEVMMKKLREWEHFPMMSRRMLCNMKLRVRTMCSILTVQSSIRILRMTRTRTTRAVRAVIRI